MATDDKEISDGMHDYGEDDAGNVPPHELDATCPLATTTRLDPVRTVKGTFLPGHDASQWARPNDIRPDEVRDCIDEYIRNGGHWLHACAKIGRSYNKVTKAMDKFPHLKDYFQEARQAFVEVLEQEADRRATIGVRKIVASAGKILGEERVYSDALLMFRLRGLAPEKYDPNRAKPNDNGPNRTGLLLVPVHPSSADWEELNRIHHERLLAPQRNDVAQLPAPASKAGLPTKAQGAPKSDRPPQR